MGMSDGFSTGFLRRLSADLWRSNIAVSARARGFLNGFLKRLFRGGFRTRFDFFKNFTRIF